MLSKVQTLYTMAASEFCSYAGAMHSAVGSVQQGFVKLCEGRSLPGTKNFSSLWSHVKSFAVPAGVMGYSGQAMAADISTTLASWSSEHQGLLMVGGVVLGEIATIGALVKFWHQQIKADAMRDNPVAAPRQQPAIAVGSNDLIVKTQRQSPTDAILHATTVAELITAITVANTENQERVKASLVRKIQYTQDENLALCALMILVSKSGNAARDDLVMLANQANLVSVREAALTKLYEHFGKLCSADYKNVAWSGSERVALLAINFIAKKREADAFLVLYKLSERHVNATVRHAARYAMSKNFARASIAILKKQIVRPYFSADWENALFCLGDITDDQAMRALEELLHDNRVGGHLRFFVRCEIGLMRSRLQKRATESDVAPRLPWVSDINLLGPVNE